MNRTEESARLSLSVWKRLLPYMKSVRRHFIMALVLMIVSALISSAYPVFTAFAVSAFIEPGQLKGLPLFVVAYFAAILVDGAASLFFFRHSMKVELYLAKDIRRKAFVHLQELSIPFFNKTSVGYLLARVMSDVDRISSVIAWGMTHALWNVGYVVGAFVYMFILKPSLALMLLAYVPVITAVVWFFQSKIIRVQRKVREVNSEITGAYNEGITGAKVTKTLVIEDVMAREFSAVTQKMYRYSIRSSRLAAFLTPLMSIAGAAAVGTVLYKGGLLVGEQLMDFGVLSALITYALGIVEPIVQLVGMLENVIVAQVGIERVTALIDEPVTVADTPEVIEKYGDVFNPKKENWEPIRGDITFDHVSFRYPDGEEDVLHDFNLHIPAGTTVAIVGETGAGKSTLVNLACRFFEPTEGRVLIDGKDARERSTLWLHSSLGYVLQTPFLFSGTIMANIRYARLAAPEYLDDEYREAGRRMRDAMWTHPYLVAGRGRICTDLMSLPGRRFLGKSGAEGVYCVGLPPETVSLSPALRNSGAVGGVGIAMKAEDGRADVSYLMVVEILDQLGLLTAEDRAALARYGPGPITNYAGRVVGERRAVFELAPASN
mgnify:CR=1 FL=1